MLTESVHHDILREDIDHTFAVTPGDIYFLTEFARLQLLQLYGTCVDALPVSSRATWPGGFVNVTLRRNGRLYGSMGSSAADLLLAIKQALYRATLDNRVGHPTLLGDLADLTIELWIEISRRQLTGDSAKWSRLLQLGVDGLRIRFDSHEAYFKPSVPLTKAIDSVEQLFANLCDKAGIDKLAWQDPTAQVEASRWIHLVSSTRESSHELCLLRGLSRSPVNKDTLWHASQLSLNRLSLIQKSNGEFGYLYRPFEDTWRHEFNTVRQAGCAYAVCRAVDFSRRFDTVTDIRATADRALSGLFAATAELNYGGLFIQEPNGYPPRGKLGAVALTALASLYSPGRPYASKGDCLIDTLLNSQEDSGAFRCSIGQQPEQATWQNFFPGEALLALTRYLLLTGNSRIPEHLGRAFTHYRTHFRREPHSAFVLWQVDAWVNVATALKAGTLKPFGPSLEDICAFIFEQIDWLLKLQHTSDNQSRKEYEGGFKLGSAPTFSSATYVEAIIRACDAAAVIGDEARLITYRRRALIGLNFLLRLQLREESAPFFVRPDLVIGGLPKSLECFDIRADYDQHFLTACLTAIESHTLWVEARNIG